MTPMRIRKFRANRASREDAEWLRDTVNRESRGFGFRVDLDEDARLVYVPGPGGGCAARGPLS